MYPMLVALSIVRHHCAKSNELEVYERVYGELECLNTGDDESTSKTIEKIEELLSKNKKLAKMLIFCIRQSQNKAKECETTPAHEEITQIQELPNLSQRILRAVQKILPKNSEKTSEANATLSGRNISVESQVGLKSSPIVQYSNANPSFLFQPIASAGQLSNSQVTPSGFFRLVPCGQAVNSTNRNFTMMPLYNKFTEMQPPCVNSSDSNIGKLLSYVSTVGNDQHLNLISKSVSTCYYTITNSSLSGLNCKSESGNVKQLRPKVQKSVATIASANEGKTLLSPAPPISKANTIRALLSVATSSKETVGKVKSLLSSPKQGELKTPARKNEKPPRWVVKWNFPPKHPKPSSDAKLVNQQVSSSNDKAQSSTDSQPLLDCSISENTNVSKETKSDLEKKSFGQLDYVDTEKQKVEDDDDDGDENALIIVDDDESATFVPRNPVNENTIQVLACHKGTKTTMDTVSDGNVNVVMNVENSQNIDEMSRQEETINFLNQLTGKPCSPQIVDIDSTEPAKNRRKRKKSNSE